MIEKRSKIISLRVCPNLYEKINKQLEEEYQKKLQDVKNKRSLTKTSLSDILEQSMINRL